MNNVYPYYMPNAGMYQAQPYGQINPYPDRLAQLQAQQQQFNQSQYNPQIPDSVFPVFSYKDVLPGPKLSWN